jgi:D-glycero-alpha-D-manno-heptose 1-phosphate guanylyltransferase
MNCDEAIVLVGGLGTRLRGVVSDVPKPLAPVAGRPFLAWVLDHLADNRIRRVVLAAGYMAEKIQQCAGNEWQGMAVDYSIEEKALGTGGAIAQARDRLRGDSAHILNGDTFLRYRLASLEDATRTAGARIGVALASVDDVSRYGAVEQRDGMISRFLEKGRSGQGLINAGSYFLGDQALRELPTARAFSFESDVLTPMTAAGQVVGYTATEGFIDIGVPEDYLRAQTLFGAAA